MTRFPAGIIILLIVSALIFFGIAQRALDRMKLSDKGALAVIAGLILGSFIEIPIWGGRLPLSVNIGGALLPLGLAIYLVSTAGTAKEKIRALIGSLVTALAIYGVGALVMTGLPEPAGRYGFIDTLWLFPLVAGIVGYLSGRSRRGAFVSATLGVLIFDIGHYVWLTTRGVAAGSTALGGAGAFDAVVISGIFAVMLAETVGEVRERMAGGPTTEGKAPSLASALRKPDMDGKIEPDVQEGVIENENRFEMDRNREKRMTGGKNDGGMMDE
ncbi:MAG: hypothetical protein VR68_01755 [Peptococcaceae bacterium BRH_c4a]|nr:MAG: hypothetical protein VR68_01755 [Peptococcaceae bacterium BRH_c4a]